MTMDPSRNRAYLKTHKFITFGLDLRQCPFDFWMDLGAVQSKIEHVAHAMLPPAVSAELREIYLAKGVHATTAIEGNTLSEDQVRARIARKSDLPESKEYLGKEVDNVVGACNKIANEVFQETGSGEAVDELTPERIKAFNRMVLDELPLGEGVIPGQLRTYAVSVGEYRAVPAEDCHCLVERLCQWLKDDFKPPGPGLSVGFAVLKAIVAHLYLAWIHPFGDGNGRTARLVEFQILLSGGVPTVSAHLLSNFYNQTRTEYYRRLSIASKAGDGAQQFLAYAVTGLRDALDEQIKHVRMFQWRVNWRDFVYERFRNVKGAAGMRQRTLALELAKSSKCRVPLSELKHLTPEIAECYAKKSARTLDRDVKTLLGMGLLVQVGKELQANSDLLTEFLPLRRTEPEARRR
jgi:cell filamentation protein, protein adenylyltransferase